VAFIFLCFALTSYQEFDDEDIDKVNVPLEDEVVLNEDEMELLHEVPDDSDHILRPIILEIPQQQRESLF